MGRVVIVAFSPKPGKEQALRELLDRHVPVLRSQGLATEREAILLKAKDGTVLELFEWVSGDAIEAAHSNPAVQELWGGFEEVCGYVRLSDLAECQQMFAEFEPL